MDNFTNQSNSNDGIFAFFVKIRHSALLLTGKVAIRSGMNHPRK